MGTRSIHLALTWTMTLLLPLLFGQHQGHMMVIQREDHKWNHKKVSEAAPRREGLLHHRELSCQGPLGREDVTLKSLAQTPPRRCPAPNSWFQAAAPTMTVTAAPAFRLFCRRAHWTRQRPFYKGSIKTNSGSYSQTSAAVPVLGSLHGTRETWQQPTGTPYAQRLSTTCRTAGWCSGRIGEWPMLVEDDGRASPASKEVHTSKWQQTCVPWRPRLLRAERFQHSLLRVTRRLRSIAHWVCQLEPLTLTRAWARHRPRAPASSARQGYAGRLPLTDTIILLHCNHWAHNHSFPKPPKIPNKTPIPRQGQPGPKSGTSLITIVFLTLCQRTSGVRVVPEVVAGTGPASAGKLHGATPVGDPTARYLRQHKRAFRRARARATASPLGGTHYKGRWHTPTTLQALLGQPQPDHRSQQSIGGATRSRPVRPFRLLCWNASSLSGNIYQELMTWLDHHPVANQYHLIMLQETHWKPTADFCSGQWQCIHSSGYDNPAGPEKSSGLLVLASRKHLQDLSVKEHFPGRLLQLQATLTCTNRPLTAFIVYQHVWRTHLTAAENHNLRGPIWHTLETACAKVPSRHHLVVAGDFNSTLKPQPPYVGHASTPSDAHNHSRELQQLVVDQDLCVLNTFNSRPRHTYYSPQARTQIDFVMQRRSEARGVAFKAGPLHSFPVGATREAGHKPLQAELQLLPFSRLPRPPKRPQPCCNVRALQQAVQFQTAQATAMLADVQQQLETSCSHAGTLCQLHSCINAALMRVAQEHFPPVTATDRRISADPGFKASALQTWQLYHSMRRPGPRTLRGLLQQWRQVAQFRRASQALRQQSRRLKQHFYLEQIKEAERADSQGDQRALFQVVKRLGPRSGRCASRLLTAEGHLMTAPQQLEAILTFSKQAFATKEDAEQPPPLKHGLDLDVSLLQCKLSKVGIRKAVPSHIAPAAMWRLCSTPVGALLGPALCRHYSAGQVAEVEGDWKDTSVVWLPKPSKKPTSVASMRPIGLQSPATKSFASALKVSVMEHLEPVVRELPQYAYLPYRGTTDALLKVHQHFEDTAALLASNRLDRFQQQAGKKKLTCIGGFSLSLDLSSAFDGVHRPTAYQTMLQHGVDRTTVNIIQSLHQEARYHFTVGTHAACVCTTNGIKQGCTIAPSIWAFFTVAVMLKMTEARSMQWLQQVCTLFADDCWGSWLIKSERDVVRAIEDIAHIIGVLEDFQLRVNYQKTAVLLRLEGKHAQRALNSCTIEKDGTTYLEVQIRGESRLLPIKSQHEYLGTAVTYHRRVDANTQKRMHAGQLRYQDIRRVLNGRHVLTIRQRTSLWRSCIYSSLAYSIPVVGLTPKSNQKLYVQTTRHLRAIARQPAHLHHTPNRAIWEDSGLSPPASLAQQLLQKHRDKLAIRSITHPDITNNPQMIAYVDSLLDSLKHLPIHPATAQYTDATTVCTIECPLCPQRFATENAMRIHCQLQHSMLPAHSTRTPTTFIPHIHAKNGLPQCSLCSRKFYRWGNLKEHIRSGACEKLGGDAAVRYPHKPAPQDDPPRQTLTEAVPEGSKIDPTEPVPEPQQQNLPLALRPSFREALHQWDQQLRTTVMRRELAQYCVLCGMWIADTRHVKQHYNKTHHPAMPDLQKQALALCLPFKAQLRRDSSCRFCGTKVGAPGRHSQQCAVLFQLCVAVAFCQDGQYGCTTGGGHLSGVLPQRTGPTAVLTSGSCTILPEQAAETGVQVKSQAGGSQRPTDLPPQPLPAGTSATSSGNLKRYFHSNVSPHASARGAAGADQERSGTGGVCQTGSAQHPPGSLQGLGCMERQEGKGRHPGGRAHAEDSAAVLCHQGNPVPAPNSDGDRSRQKQATDSRLDQCRGSLGVSKMVPEISAPRPGRDPHTLVSRQCCETAHHAERLPHGRHHPKVLGDPPALQAGGSRPSERNFLPGSVPSRQGVRCSTLHAPPAGQQHDDTLSGNIGETGEWPAVKVGTTDRGDGLQGLGQAAVLHVGDSQPTPVHPVPGPQLNPPFALANPGNYCYINSYLYALWTASVYHGTRALLPQVAGVKDEPILARHLFGFQLLGWPRPEQQHDVAELIDYLNPRLSLQHVLGQVESRRQTSEGVSRQFEGPATKCIRLLKPPRHRPTLQHLVQFWSSQDSIYALTRPDPWLFLQLPRFAQSEGRISKGKQVYHCTDHIQIPDLC